MGKVFNAVYDQFMSKRPYNKYVKCYLKVSRAKRSNTILEAGCGSGLFLQATHSFGFKPDGLDIDQDMLNIAKERVDTNLYLGDITTFNLDQKWDLIYLPLDVLDYLSRSRLKKALKNLASKLNSGGMLIFDVHGKSYLKMMQNAYSQEFSGHARYLWQSRVRGKYIHYFITCAQEDRAEEYRLKERIHTVKELGRAASFAGLSRKGRLRAWDLGKIDRHTKRQIFVYQKKPDR
ncbi:MAG: class I SAM-dependent methyltransferase [Firmicutes bacterium]|nr:class I SAM-dependent methyltransferase [Bacillota bacterium]MDD4694601.1 class I SAM-dependent methyltransferase [Bacillota bacterium]